MAETIREVIIKAKIEVEGDDALRKVQENAKKWNGELDKAKRNEQAVTNEQKKLTSETDKTRRAQVGLDDALGKVQQAIKRAAEEYARGNASAGKGLDGLIRKEKELIRQIERRETAIERARAAQGPQVGVFGRARAGVGTAVGRVSALRAAGVVAAPVALVSIAGQAATALREALSEREQLEELGISDHGAAIIGRTLARFLGAQDIVGLAGRGAEEAGGVGRLVSALARPTELFEIIGAAEKKALDAAREKQTLNQRELNAREEEIALIQRAIQLNEQKFGAEFATQQELIRKEQDRLKTIQQQAVEEEKLRRKTVTGGLAQFSRQEQQQVLSSIQRFQRGGAGALTPEELERLQRLPFSRELFEGQAQQVDQGILDAITRIIGESRREELRQEEQKARAAIIEARNVTLDVKEGITVGDIIIQTEELEDALEKATEEFAAMALKSVNSAIARFRTRMETNETLRLQGNVQ